MSSESCACIIHYFCVDPFLGSWLPPHIVILGSSSSLLNKYTKINGNCFVVIQIFLGAIEGLDNELEKVSCNRICSASFSILHTEKLFLKIIAFRPEMSVQIWHISLEHMYNKHIDFHKMFLCFSVKQIK